MTDTVSMSKGLTLLVETKVFLCRQTKAIRLPTFLVERHPEGSEGRVWDVNAAEVVCIVW